MRTFQKDLKEEITLRYTVYTDMPDLVCLRSDHGYGGAVKLYIAEGTRWTKLAFSLFQQRHKRRVKMLWLIFPSFTSSSEPRSSIR